MSWAALQGVHVMRNWSYLPKSRASWESHASAPARPSEYCSLVESLTATSWKTSQRHLAKKPQIADPHKLHKTVNVCDFKLLTCGVICSNTEDITVSVMFWILREQNQILILVDFATEIHGHLLDYVVSSSIKALTYHVLVVLICQELKNNQTNKTIRVKANDKL